MQTNGAIANWLIEAAQEIPDAVGEQPNRHSNFRFSRPELRMMN